MVISGRENFRVFRILLDNVASQSDFGIAFESFGKREFQKLSEHLKKLPTDEVSTLSPSTLRDYRYIYIRKSGYIFKAEEDKLNCLADYIQGKDWQNFSKKYLKLIPISSQSFYKAYDLYKGIYEQEEFISQIYAESITFLRQAPSSTEHILNTAICQLYLDQYDDANVLLNAMLSIRPDVSHLHHIHGFSLLSGIRPFRHHRETIHKIIYHLDMASRLSPQRVDSLYLKRIIQTDYHARIGYTFTPSAITSQTADDHMIRFFAQCSGILKSEIKSILL